MNIRKNTNIKTDSSIKNLKISHWICDLFWYRKENDTNAETKEQYVTEIFRECHYRA